MLVREPKGGENGLPRDGDVTDFGRLDDASDGWVGKEVGIVGENPCATAPDFDVGFPRGLNELLLEELSAGVSQLVPEAGEERASWSLVTLSGCLITITISLKLVPYNGRQRLNQTNLGLFTALLKLFLSFFSFNNRRGWTLAFPAVHLPSTTNIICDSVRE